MYNATVSTWMYNATVEYMKSHDYGQWHSRVHELAWVCTKLLLSTWLNINLHDYVCIGMVCNTSGLD